MATKRTARKLNSAKKRATRSLGARGKDGKVTVPAFTRAPNGQGRIRVALRVRPEELEALDLLAERWGVSFSEATRVLIQKGLDEEKLLVS
jgi:hypothetical protein